MSIMRLLFCFIGASMVLGLLATYSTVYAQDDCTTVIHMFQQAIDQCVNTPQDSACYGSTLVEVSPDPFSSLGEQRSLEKIDMLMARYPKNPSKDPIGMAVLNFLPKQATKPAAAIAYGVSVSDPNPSGIFFLRSEGNKELCENTPGGFVIRTESGEKGIITVNYVDIEMASTVFVTVPSPRQMNIINIEGRVVVTATREIRRLMASKQVTITMDNYIPVAISQPGPADTSRVMGLLATDPNGLQKVNTQPLMQTPLVIPTPLVTPTLTVTPTPICTPSLPPGWIHYTVRAGDTLSGIAAACLPGTTVDKLIQVNCLSSTLIVPGQLLVVPSCARPLVITSFSAVPDPARHLTLVQWSASGGRDPISGIVTVNIGGAAHPYPVTGRRGAINIPYPADSSCPLQAQYSLSLQDSGGDGASVVTALLILRTCKTAPFP